MADQQFTIKNSQGNLVMAVIRRDRRLKKTSRWEHLPDGSLLLRVPYRLPKRCFTNLLEQVISQVDKSRPVSKHPSDALLHLRAEQVNREHFQGKIHWNSTRWVSNMRSSLGSCTRGGTTDGEIRISDKIKGWPDWVIDYVIAHELAHRRHPNHSAAFWSELKAAYPLTERARGFIRGVSYAAGLNLEDDETDLPVPS